MGQTPQQHSHAHSGDGGGELRPDLIEPVNATISEQITHGGEPAATIYVRAAGADSNSGLSESDAKATIGAALDAVPKLRLGAQTTGIERVRIDLEAGATYNISSSLQYSMPEQVLIQLFGDGANRPQINADGADPVFEFVRTRLDVREIDFGVTSGSGRVFLLRQSIINFDGVTFSGGSTRHLHAFTGSAVEFASNVSLTGPGSSNQGIALHSGSHLTSRADISGYSIGMYFDRGSSGDVLGGIIDGCTTGCRAEDNSGMKFANATVQNCGTAANARADSNIRFTSGNTLSGNTADYDVEDVSAIQQSGGTWVTGAAH